MSTALRRALAGIRARPGASVATAAGLLLVGLLLGVAVATGYAISSGFDRAQQAASSPDVIARFDPAERDDVLTRARGLADVARLRVRRVVRPVDFVLLPRDDGGPTRFGTAELDALDPGTPADDGLALVAGRGLTGAPREVLIERGLATAWHLRAGDQVGIGNGRRRMRARVVGITLEPDVLAFPLASRPRIYVPASVAQDQLGVGDRVTSLAIWARNADRVPELLVQARSQSYGLTGLELATRASVRANIGEAAGIVLALLTAFAVMAMAAAAAMLAASAQARVLRDRGTLGTLRAVGASPAMAAASYAFEAALLALPALALGVALATWLADAPTARLLGLLNELPPHLLGWPQLAIVAGGTLVSATAAFVPALLAAREPPLRLLRDVPPAAGRGRVAGRPLALGARLAAARPLRLIATAAVLAMAAGLVLLMLGLGRFLLDVERDPAVLGDRFALAVDDGPAALAAVRSTPGVAAAVLRWQTRGADAFDLREPVTLVALGRGGEDYRLPLVSGRRAGPDEAEIGAGLADTLGLGAGGRLLAELPDGGQVSVPVAGVVRELSHDGRVAYVPPASLLRAAPDLAPQVAVALTPGATPDEVTRRLTDRGLHVVAARTSASDARELVDAVVLILRLVAIIDGLVCAGLLALAVATVVRERAATVAVVRTVGAQPGQVRMLVAGIAAAYLVLALPAAVLLEELLLGPAVSRLVGRYGDLPLGVSAADALLVVAVALALAAAVAWWLTARLLAVPVRPLLQGR